VTDSITNQQQLSDFSTEVITIGLHIVDILGRPVEAIPAGQGLALLDEIRMTVAGTCAATAVDLARLGIRVSSFGVVGADSLGSWMVQTMREEGVDTEGIVSVEGAYTSATMLPIRPNGERPALHVIGANSLVAKELIDWERVTGAKHLHVGGSLLLEKLDGTPTAEVFAKAKSLGMSTSLDIIGATGRDYEAVFGAAYENLDYLLVNEDDAKLLSDKTNLEEACAWFIERGVKNTVITVGAEGAIYRSATEEFKVSAYKIKLVDTTGCGDAFSAGFIAGLIKGLSSEECVQLGVASGSSVATGLGSDAGVSSFEELLDFMKENSKN
jgi:sugar/nucleoside kinase (ribokinase family)